MYCQALLATMISGCFPSSVLMSCHPCTVAVPAMRHRTGCGLAWWWCHPALWRRHRPVIYLSGHAGVAWSWFCTVVVAHVGHVSALSPRRKARGFPALVRFARARPAGQAVEACVLGITVESHVVGLAVEAHVARGQLLSAMSRVTRASTICLVTRGREIAHASWHGLMGRDIFRQKNRPGSLEPGLDCQSRLLILGPCVKQAQFLSLLSPH